MLRDERPDADEAILPSISELTLGAPLIAPVTMLLLALLGALFEALLGDRMAKSSSKSRLPYKLESEGAAISA